MITIKGIPAFSDNYIWCLYDENNNAIIVDPGCANSVEHYLCENNLNLTAILITHHHPDHIGGVKQLKEKYSPKVIGFQDSKLDFLDLKVTNNQAFSIMNIEFKTFEVPGHTLDHIAFYAEIPLINSTGENTIQPCLFCGDTLFSAGCGRLFEGSAEQMYNSLNSLAHLPGNTLVFCAHEYTLSNLAFAKSLMPNNIKLASYTEECAEKRKRNIPTIPSTLSIELDINPFLRTNDPEIFQSLVRQDMLKSKENVEIFRAIRKAKDNF